jgi:hypothetical protein
MTHLSHGAVDPAISKRTFHDALPGGKGVARVRGWPATRAWRGLCNGFVSSVPLPDAEAVKQRSGNGLFSDETQNATGISLDNLVETIELN